MARKKGNKDGKSGSGGDYEVGYGKPPTHSQFQKGKSGNPKGPKKGSRSLKTDLDAALKTKLSINAVGGKMRRGTTQELAMYTLAVKAAHGDLRASRLLADLVMSVFGPGERGGEKARLSKRDAELLARLLEREDADDPNEEATPTLEPDAGDGGTVDPAADNDADDSCGDGADGEEGGDET